MTLEPGALLHERYRINGVLGQGGMGAVYLATDESLGLQVAVKENLNPSPEAEKQFLREAQLLASLRHHNLPRVTNHFVLANQQYLVMDFVEGEDLKERLGREGPLPEVDVLLWAAQICDALSYLHRRSPPVIHRDIKPANIKINPADEVMLVDFGIAKASAAGQKTTTGAVALTPGFAPPEQYGMGRTDPRTDQYALAATLYNLLTGQAPPDSMERLLGNVPLTPPAALRPEISPEVSAALLRALELKPDERFESVEAFKGALFGKLPAEASTVRARAAEATVAQPADRTRVAEQVTTAPGETIVSRGTAPPATRDARRQGVPGWLIPAGIGGGVVLVVGALAFGLAGMAGLGALRPSDTPTTAPTRTEAPPTSVVLPATHTSEPTPVPASPTPTSSPEPPPTDTPTPEPPTPTVAPTIAGTPFGGGPRIAFISNRDGRFFQVYTMAPDGSDVQQLTFDERHKWLPDWKLGNLGSLSGTQLAWSPDGTKLMYVAEGGPGSGLDLWVINADGTNSLNITAARAGQSAGDDFQPAWCADGTIAFTSTRVNRIPQIFITHLDNLQQRNFSAVHSSPIEFGVAWFPDCKRLLLVTTQNGAPELWRVFPFEQTYAGLWQTFPAADQQSYRVFLSDLGGYNAAAEEPAISPSGANVLYTRRAPGGNDVILTTVSNSQLTMQIQQLTTTRNNAQAQWSPDGTWVVFVSRRDGNSEVYRMAANGGNQVNLTNHGATDVSPAWQPVASP